MSFVHGKDTYISIAGHDISVYTTESSFDLEADEHDVTAYGKDSHVVQGGLKKSSGSMGGTYDNTTAGPHDVISPLVGTNVTLVRRPEGTGSGLPQETVTVHVRKYSESNPVADMVKWSCDFTGSDDVTEANQS